MNVYLKWWILSGVCLAAVRVVTSETVVEGFEGGAFTVPCTVKIGGDLRWTAGGALILVKPVNGKVLISRGTLFANVASLVEGTNDLQITSLDHQRDNNRIFKCRGTIEGSQNTQVRVLAKVTAVEVEGQLTIKEGDSKTLTCAVSGSPNPPPSYTWTVDNREVSTDGPSYSLRADRSRRTVKCTATNLYINGSILSTAVDEVTLDVLYLDTPTTTPSVNVTENDRVTLQCSAEGNPPPAYGWNRSQSEDVLSSSADYTIETAQRTDAGVYNCFAYNDLGRKQVASTLIVHYPPDVIVSFAEITRTLTCAGHGVPFTNTFSLWEHRLGGTLIRSLGTATKGRFSSYTFPGTLTYEDTGNYVCSVTNGIRSPQNEQINIAPITGAVFEDQPNTKTIKMGKTETISVGFYTKLSSGFDQVEWKKSGKISDLVSHLERKGPVSLVFYGQAISLEGTVTEVTLVDVSEANEGNYTVTVRSDINGVTETQSISFYVNVIIPAEGPIQGTPTSNIGGIVGGVVGGGTVVIIIAITVVLTRRRLNTNDSVKTNNNSYPTPVDVNHGKDRTVRTEGHGSYIHQDDSLEADVSYLEPVADVSTGNSRTLPSNNGSSDPNPANTYEMLNTNSSESPDRSYEILNVYSKGDNYINLPHDNTELAYENTTSMPITQHPVNADYVEITG